MLRTPTSRRSALRTLALVATAGTLDLRPAQAHEAHAHPGKSGTKGLEPPAGLVRTSAEVILPDTPLQRETGQSARLADSLSTQDPVLLNFIYTSCTAVCPVQTQVFAQLQSQLEKARRRVRMVSVSIDPLHDTPQRLAAYARQFGAGSQWHFLTGTPQASMAVQRAFDTWRGDKMNHPVVTFIRPPGRQTWVRIEGYATAADLLRELREPPA